MTKSTKKTTDAPKEKYFFTGEVTFIRHHQGGMTELSVTYPTRPRHQWVALKLFGAARQLATGQQLVVDNPFAAPDSLAWTKCPKVRKGDMVTVETTSKPVETDVVNAKGVKRKTEEGRVIKKITFNLNSTREVRILKPAE